MTQVLSGQAYPILSALGRGLIHSVWECAAVWAMLAWALALLRGRSPRARYAAGCVALALMLLLPAVTVWKFLSARTEARAQDSSEWEWVAAEPSAESGVWSSPAGASVAVSAGRANSASSRPLVEGNAYLLAWLTLLWLTGVTALSARTLGGLMFARGLRVRGVRPVEPRWRERACEIARRLRVRRAVSIFESSLVAVPTVVGWLRPAILLPASAFTGLTPEQLEAVLAHELAHVRRHDYLVNVLQTCAETLLFYHPAVWWASRQVREEREHVCDDMAVGVTGDALVYARALTKVERLRAAAPPRLALAADGGSLRSRVLRLLEGPPRARRFSPFAVGICFAAAVLTTIACARAVISEQQHATPARGSKAEAARALDKKSSPDNSTATASGIAASSSSEAASLVASDVTEGEDAEVRRVAVEALGGRAGSVVVLDPRTGRVYAVVNQEWALRRGWVPASTMKLVTSLACVGEKLCDPLEKVRVQGRAERLDLTDALALSDNDYFKSLGARVGAGPILDYARRLGLGERTGINYEGEVAGRLPELSAVSSAARLGFGEGVEVTPVQLAVLVSAVANGGTLVVPRVPRTQQEAAWFKAESRGRVEVPEGALARLAAGMSAAVERGTAGGARDPSLKVAGKTGTLEGRRGDLGLFASYAPADDPRLTVVVLTSGEGVNGAAAAKIAGAVYRALRGRLTN